MRFERHHGAVALAMSVGILTCPLLAYLDAQEGGDPGFGTIGLGDEPVELPANLRAQAETHLTRSFSNPDILLGTLQEGRHTDGGAVANGYVLSTDGGASWTRALIPHLTTAYEGGAFERASDPVAGIDTHGNLYLNSLGVDFNLSGLLVTQNVLTRSTDGGASFSEPLIVYAPPDPRFFADKNWMAINTFPGTPNPDRIVVTIDLFEAPAAGQPDRSARLAATYSDDMGSTWSPLTITGPNWVQGITPMFLPTGDLVIPYWNFGAGFGTDTDDSIELTISRDGGATFGPPVAVARPVYYDAPRVRDGSDIFSVATDRQAGVIYLAYQADANPASAVEPRIMFTRSIDHGSTWSPPVAISDNPTGSPVFIPAIASSADGQHVTVIYYDQRHGIIPGPLADLYYTESFDGGDTWEPGRRVGTTSFDMDKAPLTEIGRMLGDYQGIVPALDFDTPGYALWIDIPGTSPDPFITELPRTRGTTFATWQKLRFTGEQLAMPEVSGPDADPDGDRLSNLLEYALASEPSRPDPMPVHYQFDQALGRIIGSYTALPVLSDIEFEWRVSHDLLTWETAIPAAETGATDATFGFLRTVAAEFDATGAEPTYYRLEVKLMGGG